jgi:hypothetical protein
MLETLDKAKSNIENVSGLNLAAFSHVVPSSYKMVL